MKLAEIEQAALSLSDRERASLAAKLLDTLPLPGTEVSDDEVERRESELESGQVTALSHEEFIRRVQQERRRWPPSRIEPVKTAWPISSAVRAA